MPSPPSQPPRPGRPAHHRLLVAALLAVGAAGCGTPPELQGSDPVPPASATAEPDGPAAPSPAAPPSGAGLSMGPGLPGGPPGPGGPGGPSAPGPSNRFADATAVPCAGEPTAAQLVAAIRATPGALPAGARLRLRSGPYCAATWQYAVLQVVADPEPEPLQVVTRGRPRALTVVTTGTNVCTVTVRVEAPPGIRALACDNVPAASTSASAPPSTSVSPR